MYIGNVYIKNRVVLAPMAGVCNSAFRRIIKEMGCGLIYAEMVSDKAIFYNNKKTIDMLYMSEFERPIVQQVFGSDKKSFVEAAKYICSTMKPDILDINMGCPVPKVAIGAQAGSALLKDLNKIEEIVSAVVESCNCPVTVKIRSGWDSSSINAIEVAKICEKAGASAIAIHPRTRSQGYNGKADWDIIKKVKENVSIPVIGNGDINDIYKAKEMLDYTNCDFIMIGRATLGNPWLIKDIINYIENNELPEKVMPTQKIDMCIKHFRYLLAYQKKKQAVLEIRSHIAWYLKGLKGANEVKRKIFTLKDKDAIFEALEQYKKELQND